MMARRKQQPEPLSEQLQKIILDSGLTQYRISKESRISQSQLYRFMKTGRCVSIEVLDRIGQALGLRLVRDVDSE